jgi:hypothetical protein
MAGLHWGLSARPVSLGPPAQWTPRWVKFVLSTDWIDLNCLARKG